MGGLKSEGTCSFVQVSTEALGAHEIHGQDQDNGTVPLAVEPARARRLFKVGSSTRDNFGEPHARLRVWAVVVGGVERKKICPGNLQAVSEWEFVMWGGLVKLPRFCYAAH